MTKSKIDGLHSVSARRSRRGLVRSDPRCILVVEDHDDTRLMLRTILEMNGFSVLEAIDGETAVQTAEKEYPDIILMDLGLPTVDGFGAMRRIREHSAIGETPIIFLSGWAEPAAQRAALAAGCNDYLVKPIDFDRMMSVIERWLSPNAGSMAAQQESLNEV